MDFSFEIKGNQIYICFNGDILFDETTGLAIKLKALMKEQFQEAVLDFSQVTGITSSAIGSVIDFHQQLKAVNRTMRIKGMSEKAYSVFKYFKLDELFPIEK